jgi:hypothetical protein
MASTVAVSIGSAIVYRLFLHIRIITYTFVYTVNVKIRPPAVALPVPGCLPAFVISCLRCVLFTQLSRAFFAMQSSKINFFLKLENANRNKLGEISY